MGDYLDFIPRAPSTLRTLSTWSPCSSMTPSRTVPPAPHAARRLAAYPPLVDAAGRRIAQAEHTVYVGSNGVEVLTD